MSAITGSSGTQQTANTTSGTNSTPQQRSKWELVSQIARGALVALLTLLSAAAGFAFGGGVTVLFGGTLVPSMIVACILGAAVGAATGYYSTKFFKPHMPTM